MSNSPKKPTGFFHLPQELQDMITIHMYAHLVASPCDLIIGSRKPPPQESISTINSFKNIRAVCRQFHHKAGEIFFANNTFVIHTATETANEPDTDANKEDLPPPPSISQDFILLHVNSIMVHISLPGLHNKVRVFRRLFKDPVGGGKWTREETSIYKCDDSYTEWAIIFRAGHARMSLTWEVRLESKASGEPLVMEDLNAVANLFSKHAARWVQVCMVDSRGAVVGRQPGYGPRCCGWNGERCDRCGSDRCYPK